MDYGAALHEAPPDRWALVRPQTLAVPRWDPANTFLCDGQPGLRLVAPPLQCIPSVLAVHRYQYEAWRDETRNRQKYQRDETEIMVEFADTVRFRRLPRHKQSVQYLSDTQMRVTGGHPRSCPLDRLGFAFCFLHSRSPTTIALGSNASWIAWPNHSAAGLDVIVFCHFAIAGHEADLLSTER
jgi:hypothetical protein